MAEQHSEGAVGAAAWEESERFYETKDGAKVPSVTTILKHANAAPFYQNNLAAERGTAVHKALELLDLGTLDFKSLNPAIVGYVRAYEEFLRLTKFEPVEIEQQIINLKYRYGGRLDRVYRSPSRPRVRFLTDIKSGGLEYQAALQTAAYSEGRDDQRSVLQLRSDGTFVHHSYRVQDNKKHFLMFTMAATLFHFSKTKIITL